MMNSPTQVLPFNNKNLEDKLQSILNCMPVALSWANSNTGKIEFVNREFISIFGYDVDDIKTVDGWYEIAYLNPKDIESIRQSWSECITNAGMNVSEIAPVENELLCKDGKVKSIVSRRISLPIEGWSLATFVDVTEHKQQEKIIYEQAMKDHLTGLLNRRAFDNALQFCLKNAEVESRKVGLLILDLDNFKQLNDTHGHDQGDVVLKEVAMRLKLATRQQNVCRIGGDEFGVIIDDIEDLGIVEKVIERIFSQICKTVPLDEGTYNLQLSAGVSIYPDDAKDNNGLYKEADNALYRAKNNGRAQWSH